MAAVVNSNPLLPEPEKQAAGSLTEQPFRVQCTNLLIATVILGGDELHLDHPRLRPGQAGTTFTS